MLDDAPLVLEGIAPEDKNRNEVLGARVNLYTAAKKWELAVASRAFVHCRAARTAGRLAAKLPILMRAPSPGKTE